MSYRWLDKVTCDKCGGVIFEKFRCSSAERVFRIETIETWLTDLEWSFSDGLSKGHLCPTCTKNLKGKTP